jgi:hypothetical protein
MALCWCCACPQLKLEGAVSRSVRDVLLPLDNSDDEGYITMPTLGAPANVLLFPEEAQQLRLSAMPTLDHALQYLLGPSPSAGEWAITCVPCD